MASITELVKGKKTAGSGNFSALISSVGQKSLEKIDPRNYMFNRSGLAATMFPGLKGYQAKIKKSESKEQNDKTDKIDGSLESIKTTSAMTAKNTLVLPIMARDMNVMRQSLIKLVKLAGGTQRDKADKFFLSAKEREALYESDYKDRKSKNTKPTPEKDKEKEKDKGLFETILGAIGLGAVGSMFGGVVKSIGDFALKIMGGFAILSAIPTIIASTTAFLTRGLLSLGGVLTGPMGLVAAIMGAATLLHGWNRKNSAEKGDIRGSKGLETTYPKLGMDFGFTEGEEFYNAMSGKKTAVADLQRIRKDYMEAGTPQAKAAIPVLTAQIEALQAKQELEEFRDKNPKPSIIRHRTGKISAEENERTSKEQLAQWEKQHGEKQRNLESRIKTAEETEKKYKEQLANNWAYAILVGTKDKQYVPKFLEKDVEKIMANPPQHWKNDIEKTRGENRKNLVNNWAYSISEGLSFMDEVPPDMKEEVAAVLKNPPDWKSIKAQNEKKSSGVNDDIAKITAQVEQLQRDAANAAAGIIPPAAASTTPTPAAPAQSTTPTPASYAEKVGQGESHGNYDITYGKKGVVMLNGKKLSENTIDEVAAWQQTAKKTNTQAAGKYQFMDVAYVAKSLTGLKGTDLFSPANQEKMMVAYTEANRKGLKAALGRDPKNWELRLAHAVGVGGGKKPGAVELIRAEEQGKGNLIPADILKLGEKGRRTNPQLVENTVSQYLGGIRSEFGEQIATPNAVPASPSQPNAVPPAPSTGQQIGSATAATDQAVQQQRDAAQMNMTKELMSKMWGNSGHRTPTSGSQGAATPPLVQGDVVNKDYMKLLLERQFPITHALT